ncbi:hypothetical protein [Salibacterium salarium]|uniref:hypothetical protein n=1 Tax=Salibacterium salarium TaxID=284579 RepID=UPI000F779897|nr:hypothetical protein [Salibacterium salarium]
MEYTISRHSTYCHTVDRYINYEISTYVSRGNIEFSATCTGIDDTCVACPILTYNEKYPPLSENRLPVR